MVIMFTLHNIQALLALMSRLIAYFLVITPAGAFHAWVTKKMGDASASEMGLESLNPLVHVDIIGIICLTLFRFGWGRQIPINPQSISGKHRVIKLATASFASIPIYLVQAIIYIALLAVMFGGTLQIFTNQNVSSLTLVIRNILITGAMLSIFLLIIELVFKGVMFLVTILTEKQYIQPQHVWYTLFIIPIILLLILGQTLQNIFISQIFKIADAIAWLFGIT